MKLNHLQDIQLNEFQILPSISKNPPLVSIVILCFNDLAYIKKLLPDIYNKTKYPNIEIIVVDNGSSDDIETFIVNEIGRQNDIKIKFIGLKTNIGFGKGMNIGIKNSKGKYVVCLNTDIILPEKWLTYLVSVAESDDNIGLVGLQNIRYNLPKYPVYSVEPISCVDTYVISFSIFLYRKSLTDSDRVGLFDRFFFLYYEDTDLIYRVHLENYKVVKINSSFVIHDRFLNSGQSKPIKKINKEFSMINKKRIMVKSEFYFYFKWLSKRMILSKMFDFTIRIIVYGLVKRNYEKIRGSLLGLWDIFKNFPFVVMKRVELRKKYPHFRQTMNEIEKMKKEQYLNPEKRMLYIYKHIYLEHYWKQK